MGPYYMASILSLKTYLIGLDKDSWKDSDHCKKEGGGGGFDRRCVESRTQTQ